MVSCPGIWPVRELCWRLMVFRYWQSDRFTGISPVNELKERSMEVMNGACLQRGPIEEARCY